MSVNLGLLTYVTFTYKVISKVLVNSLKGVWAIKFLRLRWLLLVSDKSKTTVCYSRGFPCSKVEED